MSSAPFQGLSFVEVVEKLQEDKRFSNLFEAFALNAAVAGLDSPAGQALLRFFAKDEAELAQLTAATDALEQVLTVNRRTTQDTTTTATPGITTTGSTLQCEAAGIPAGGFAVQQPIEADEPDEQ